MKDQNVIGRLRCGWWTPGPALRTSVVVPWLFISGCDQKAVEPGAPTTTPAVVASSSAAPLVSDPSARSVRSELASEPATADAEPCVVLCDRSRELGCKKQQECPALCRQMLDDGSCKAELTSAFRCFAREPASNWECGEEGIASIKDGYCDAQQARYFGCMAKTMGRR